MDSERLLLLILLLIFFLVVGRRRKQTFVQQFCISLLLLWNAVICDECYYYIYDQFLLLIINNTNYYYIYFFIAVYLLFVCSLLVVVLLLYVGTCFLSSPIGTPRQSSNNQHVGKALGWTKLHLQDCALPMEATDESNQGMDTAGITLPLEELTSYRLLALGVDHFWGLLGFYAHVNFINTADFLII